MRYPLFILGLIFMTLFGSIGTYLFFDSRNVTTSTMTKEQEPELDAKVFERMKMESTSGNRIFYDSIRSQIIEKDYTQHSYGPMTVSASNAVLFVLSGVGLLMVLAGGTMILLDNLHIPEYVETRRKYIQDKTKSERVILNELIELQRKISRVDN